ncbi:MAG: DegT/DnrJ/EryC1/StrS family aminotransferase [Acidobacteriota bacterium]|nr:DegT/DnrJ/EryC1/StrS family aminotransferase [Acidobacteriota bacterium]
MSDRHAETMRIHLADDTIDADELAALCRWIQSGSRLTKGELTREFEDDFSRYIGAPHAVFVNSGSSANLLMLYVLDVLGELRNRRVVAPAISWSTTVAPAMQLGMEIELCDCDRTTLGLDPQHFEALCREHKPAAAIVVHVLGHACQLEPIRSICAEHEVILIEDACEALGTRSQGRLLGTHGVMGSFSFYYGHQLSTIEGGVLAVSERRLYNTLLSLRAHGWARDLDPAYKKSWEQEFAVDEVRSLYTFYYPGFNFRPTDLQAFLGLSQMRKAARVVETRQRNFELYREALGGDFWCQTSDTEQLSSFAFGTLVANRLEVFQHLRQRGVESRPLVCGNIGRQPFWIRRYGELALPNADLVHEYGIYLPNHAGLSPTDVGYVTEAFREVAVPKPWG